MSKHIAIIGAGIVGVSTAIHLQRSGHKVTIIDKNGPASGTSYGNAGVLAAASVVPVTVPGLLKKAPGMLLDANSPLFVRWSYLPRMLPFLRQYLGNANDEKVARISEALSYLLNDTLQQHQKLAAGTGAEQYLHPSDYVFGYSDKDAYDADSYGWNLRRKHGFIFEEMDADSFAAHDPAFAGKFGFGVRCPDHGRISDPGAYVKALAAHVEKNGGVVKRAEVLEIVNEGGTAKGVRTSAGTVDADEIVIAAGAWSKPLCKQLGLTVPMESERGYHIEFVNPSIVPRSPVMVASGKFVITPMKGRLRCAGIVEFGGLNDKRSKAPIELLKRQTKQVLPDLEYDRIDEWMGHRPSTSDSLPLIGQLETVKNVWCGFGHQHIGLTSGPKTGHILSELVQGNRLNVDLAIFTPQRFPTFEAL